MLYRPEIHLRFHYNADGWLARFKYVRIQLRYDVEAATD